MGWLTFHETRTAKQYFIDTFKNETHYELLDVAIVNFRTAYLAVKDLEKGYVCCLVYLLHRAPKSYHNFGYKSMSEFAGPGVDDCPKRIIDKLTPLDEINKVDPEIGNTSIGWAKDWRQRVLENLNKKKAIKKGGIIKTKEPLEFTSGASFQYFKKEGRKTFAIINFGLDSERYVQVKINNLKYIEHEII